MLIYSYFKVYMYSAYNGVTLQGTVKIRNLITFVGDVSIKMFLFISVIELCGKNIFELPKKFQFKDS